MLKRQEQTTLFGENQSTPVKNDRPEAAALFEVLKAIRNHSTVAWCERQNSGAAKIGGRFIRFGWRGCSDIIGQLKDGRLLACEVKAPKGKLRDEQQVFIDQVNHAGGVAFMARNYLDVQEALQATQLKQLMQKVSIMSKEALYATESTPTTIDGTTGRLDPTPREIHLKTIDNVRLEMAKVYRDMRRGVVDTGDGTKLVYVLAQIGKMIELHDIETRLNILEGNKDG